jgi:hypothetical protein
MALSAELQTRYTSEIDVDWVHGFILSHPNAGTRYLCSGTAELQGVVDGNPRTFTPVPVEITPASRDDSGRSDMTLTFCGIQDEALGFLYDALDDATKPITCRYSIFIPPDTAPQVYPWLEFQLTGISVTDTVVSATASRSNVVNIAFPTEVYRVERYPGLRRR